MANKTISDLRELSTVSNSNVLVVETNAETFKVTKENLLKEVNEQLNTKSNINHTHDEYVTDSELNAKGYATETFVTNKIEEAQLGGGVILSNIEPLDDDIPRIFFSEGTLPTSKVSTTMKIEYFSKTKTFSGYVDIKCQGTSSIGYPKKNFTIKIYHDQAKTQKFKQNFRGWGEQNKFCLKANYIDISHARNVVSAKLWGDCVKSRNNFDTLPNELKTSPNYGAIDGFFVKVYANGVYQGRYTMNIPKDGWMSNMDSSLDTHCILCGENYVSGCFRRTAVINGTDWSDELHDVVPSSIVSSFNNAIDHVMNTDDETFKANLGQYFDIDSLIDYYCFQYVICGLDSMGKNQLYLTYDGIKWFADSYDMDSTWGLYWDGTRFVSANYRMQEEYESMVDGRRGNLLYMRLEQCFVNEIKERYAQLRNGALSITNIINKFENFMICSNDLIAEDYSIFAGIPSQTTNNLQQIRKYAIDRLAYVDECINNLVTPVLCTSISLNASSLTFTDNTPQNLTVTVEPSDTTETISWQATPPYIVRIVDGLVTPLKNGTCVITVTCGSQTASCNVTVDGIEEVDVPEGYIKFRFLDNANVKYHNNSVTANTYPYELYGSKGFDLGHVDNEYTDRIYCENPEIAAVSDKNKLAYDDRCVAGCTDEFGTWILLKVRKTDLADNSIASLKEYLIQNPVYVYAKVKANLKSYSLSEVVDSIELKNEAWNQTSNICGKFEVELSEEIYNKATASNSEVFVSSISTKRDYDTKNNTLCCFNFEVYESKYLLHMSIYRELYRDSLEGFKQYIIDNNVCIYYLE